MTTYVLLMKLTQQGIKTIKTAPARIEASIKAWETTGGKFLGFYAVMGEYDYIAIGEAPSDEAAATFSLVLAAQGNVKVATLRAFTQAEFAALVEQLP